MRIIGLHQLACRLGVWADTPEEAVDKIFQATAGEQLSYADIKTETTGLHKNNSAVVYFYSVADKQYAEECLMSHIMYYRDQGVSVADVFDPQDQLWVNDIITAAIKAKNGRRISRFRIINVGGRPKVLAQQPNDKQYKELRDPLAWLTRRPVAAKDPLAVRGAAGGVSPAAAQAAALATVDSGATANDSWQELDKSTKKHFTLLGRPPKGRCDARKHQKQVDARKKRAELPQQSALRPGLLPLKQKRAKWAPNLNTEADTGTAERPMTYEENERWMNNFAQHN